MNSNNYTTPTAKVGVPTASKGAPVKAVLFALLVDIGGTILITSILSVIYGVLLLRANVSQSEIETMLTKMEPFSTYGLVLSAAGLFCSFWGGYVCALNSKINIVRDTSIYCVLSIGFAILISGTTYSPYQHILMGCAGIIAIFAGALLWKRTHS